MTHIARRFQWRDKDQDVVSAVPMSLIYTGESLPSIPDLIHVQVDGKVKQLSTLGIEDCLRLRDSALGFHLFLSERRGRCKDPCVYIEWKGVLTAACARCAIYLHMLHRWEVVVLVDRWGLILFYDPKKEDCESEEHFGKREPFRR